MAQVDPAYRERISGEAFEVVADQDKVKAAIGVAASHGVAIAGAVRLPVDEARPRG